MPTTQTRRSPRRSTPRRVLAGRIALGVVGAAMLALVVVVGWAGVAAMSALPHIEKAQQLARDLNVGAVAAGDETQLNAMRDEIGQAHDLTSGPVWAAASALPWVGPQLDAAGTLVSALDDLADDAQAALDQVGDGGVAALMPSASGFDVEAIAALAEPIGTLQTTVTEARREIEAIPSRALIPDLREATGTVGALLSDLDGTLGAVQIAVDVLPPLLGADAPRDHLLLLQNNAEWRSLGGLAGSIVQLRADGGSVRLTDQQAASSMTSYDEALVSLDPELEQLYGERPARFMHNVTMLPEFPAAASTARTIWADQMGTEVSSVFSMDPVTLSYLLEATGPVRLADGRELTSDNAVQLLLNQVYLDYPNDNQAQDAFFASASASIFAAMLSGDADPAVLLSAFTRAIDEDRFFAWSSETDVQEQLAGTRIAGEMPASDDDESVFGLFLNDSTGSKMSYYVDTATSLERCTDGTVGLGVAMTSTAPENIAELSPYIAGASSGQTASGVDVGTARTLVHIFLPEGAEISTFDIDQGSLNVLGTYKGRTVYEWWNDLAPGQSASLSLRADITTGPALDLRSTPLMPSDLEAPAC